MLAVTEEGMRKTVLAREHTMSSGRESEQESESGQLRLQTFYWVEGTDLTWELTFWPLGLSTLWRGQLFTGKRESPFLTTEPQNQHYGLCDCRRTCSWGRGIVEERRRRGDMMELGHPVRDLKSPSGELHRGLLSWAAICHWPRCSLTPSARCVLAFVCTTVK